MSRDGSSGRGDPSRIACSGERRSRAGMRISGLKAWGPALTELLIGSDVLVGSTVLSGNTSCASGLGEGFMHSRPKTEQVAFGTGLRFPVLIFRVRSGAAGSGVRDAVAASCAIASSRLRGEVLACAESIASVTSFARPRPGGTASASSTGPPFGADCGGGGCCGFRRLGGVSKRTPPPIAWLCLSSDLLGDAKFSVASASAASSSCPKLTLEKRLAAEDSCGIRGNEHGLEAYHTLNFRTSLTV